MALSQALGLLWSPYISTLITQAAWCSYSVWYCFYIIFSDSQLCHLKRRTKNNSNEADVLTNAILTLAPGNLLCVLKVFCQHTSLKSRSQTQGWEIWLPWPWQPHGSEELRSIGSDFSGLQSDFDAHPWLCRWLQTSVRSTTPLGRNVFHLIFTSVHQNKQMERDYWCHQVSDTWICLFLNAFICFGSGGCRSFVVVNCRLHYTHSESNHSLWNEQLEEMRACWQRLALAIKTLWAARSVAHRSHRPHLQRVHGP